jgi:hypothetical protein
MAYVPDWERLSDALKRFTVAGFARKKAKIIICRLIANKTFKIRLTTTAPVANPAAEIIEDWNQTILRAEGLARRDTHVRLNKRTGQFEVGDSFEGANIKIPSHLAPEDFDWRQSRPWKPWLIGPREWKSEERRSFSWRNRPISLIEVHTIDVITWIEADSTTAGEKPDHARNERRHTPQQRKSRRRVSQSRQSQRPNPQCSIPRAAASETAATQAKALSIKHSDEQSAAPIGDEATRAASIPKLGEGAKTRGIVEAITQLWPNARIPPGLTPKERDNAIIGELKRVGSSIPSVRTIQRTLATLKKAQQSK